MDTWVDDELHPPLPVDHGQLREAQVVANANSEAPCWGVHHCENLSRGQSVRFPEGDLARDVNVEQVHLQQQLVRLQPGGVADAIRSDEVYGMLGTALF